MFLLKVRTWKSLCCLLRNEALKPGYIRKLKRKLERLIVRNKCFSSKKTNHSYLPINFNSNALYQLYNIYGDYYNSMSKNSKRKAKRYKT